jgi:uncharacterized protein involved in type VI secretion and phage assembly
MSMFNPANETHFSLSIEGLEHDLQVLEFSGREAISQPYRFEVELISENAELDLQSLLHQRAFLAFTPDGLGIHGLIYQVAQAESGKRLTRYTLSIVPQLSYLALRTNQRIFQHLTVPQIIAQVLHRPWRLPVPARPNRLSQARLLRAVRRERPALHPASVRRRRHSLSLPAQRARSRAGLRR